MFHHDNASVHKGSSLQTYFAKGRSRRSEQIWDELDQATMFQKLVNARIVEPILTAKGDEIWV